MPVHTGLSPNTNTPEPGVKPQWQDISARLLLATARSSKDTKWAAWVRVSRVRKMLDSEGRIVYRFFTTTSKPNTPPNRGHFCTIRARNANYPHTAPVARAKALLFSCDCARWVYTYEYAMWSRGAAELLYCNGEYPIVTNPSRRIGACKHLIHALTRLIAANL